MNKTKHICTYFDFNFLPRGLALYNSIKRYNSEFIFYVLAFDEETYKYLNNLKIDNLVPISFKVYNAYFNTNPDKYDDKKQYYFSATPNICLYIIENYREVDLLLYLDADVFLFDSLDSLYEEVGKASIAYCPHRTHRIFDIIAKNHGKYNVGVNFFRNSEQAKKCLTDWKNKCEEWYNGIPGYHLNYFSDQIFLDDWENEYTGVKIIEHIGVNVAPWNIVNIKFYEKGNRFYVNGVPLVIYHFSSLIKVSNGKWNCNTIIYFGSVKNTLTKVYKMYIREIESFGIDNNIVELIKLKSGLGKKIFYYIVRIFLNENVNT
jgi:hypothetical protein